MRGKRRYILAFYSAKNAAAIRTLQNVRLETVPSWLGTRRHCFGTVPTYELEL